MYKRAIIVFVSFMAIVSTGSAMEERYKLFDQDQIEEFLYNFPDKVLSHEYDSPLHDAVKSDQEATVKRLLEEGANPNELVDGIRPLYWAIFNLDTPIAALLCRYGADPTKIVNEKLNQTAQQFAESVLSWVWDHGYGSESIEKDLIASIKKRVYWLM